MARHIQVRLLPLQINVLKLVSAAGLVGLMVLANVAVAAPGVAASGCPLEHPDLRDIALALFDAEALESDRLELGLAPSDSVHLALLVSPADDAACAEISSDLGAAGGPEYIHSYYRVGSYYVTVNLRVREDGYGLGALVVLNSAFDVVLAVGV